MRSIVVVLIALAATIAGCNSSPPEGDTGVPGDTGLDAPRDCQAVCITGLSSPCECMLPCGGHLTVATCSGGTCQCTRDGTPTFSYPLTECAPQPFMDGCAGLTPDAGTDAGAADAGTDAAQSDSGLGS